MHFPNLAIPWFSPLIAASPLALLLPLSGDLAYEACSAISEACLAIAVFLSVVTTLVVDRIIKQGKVPK